MYEDTWNELVLKENIFDSLNYNARKENQIITHIIIHITGNDNTSDSSFEKSKNVFTTPESTSIHYMIKGNGIITQFVKDKNVAYHAGIEHNKGIIISNQIKLIGDDKKIRAGELYDRSNNEWKHWRQYWGTEKTYERFDAFADSPVYKMDWDKVHPGRNKPFNYENNKNPNDYSIGIELVGPTFYKTSDYNNRAEQINGLVKLLKNLIEKYNIKVDREHILGHEDVNPIERFCWDPGPGFDWEDLLSRLGNQFCFPFEEKQTTKSTPSVQWYANTEARKMGGYFPIGANRSFHSGVHLFSGQAKQAIKAMAPGYVTAFRFLSNADFHNALYDFRKETSLTHAKSTSFVLLRHEVKFEGEDASRSFYSLYMDIENPENNDTEIIPWLSKLKNYTLGSRISFEYKTLSITDHWEVFSDDREENNNFQGAAA